MSNDKHSAEQYCGDDRSDAHAGRCAIWAGNSSGATRDAGYSDAALLRRASLRDAGCADERLRVMQCLLRDAGGAIRLDGDTPIFCESIRERQHAPAIYCCMRSGEHY
jgi:hypothetical protein